MTSVPGGAARFAADARDGFVFAKDVGDAAFGGGDDFAVFDEQGHGGI